MVMARMPLKTILTSVQSYSMEIKISIRRINGGYLKGKFQALAIVTKFLQIKVENHRNRNNNVEA
jgi:hypothetical protein